MCKSILLVAVMTLILMPAACTLVETGPDTRRVKVLSEGEVTGCERLGVTRVATIASFGLFDRYAKSIDEELRALARGSALDMGGNAVVPLTEVVDGRQSFAVYRCPDFRASRVRITRRLEAYDWPPSS